MFKTGISASAEQSLAILRDFDWLKPFYLAGGTALSLQLGHRLSFDLDFFTPEEFDSQKINADLIATNKYKLDRFAVNTLLGNILETKISFFTYKYPLIGPKIDLNGVSLVSISDIAAMKIDAIGGRGTKRDFVDLYFICKQLSLNECFDLYCQKYGSDKNNLFHLIRSLSYFVDAESPGQELKMLKDVSWGKVKKFFEQESIRLANEHLS